VWTTSFLAVGNLIAHEFQKMFHQYCGHLCNEIVAL
jgi:hypothetical protein